MPHASQLIVCEKKGRWAAALRWHQGARPIPLQELRSLQDVRSALCSPFINILALETTAANAEEVLHLVYDAQRQWPASPVIVLLSPEVRGLAKWYWEAGAAWVVVSPRRLELVTRWVERYLARQELPDRTLREAVWSRLPWPTEAS